VKKVDDIKVLAIQVIDKAVALEPRTAEWRSIRIPILDFRADHSTAVEPLSYTEA
jgi:hypothetical protein